MRAYFAILKDSFHEALASRVLLIALLGIVVVLLLLTPFSLHTDVATELRRSELMQPERFLNKLVDQSERETSPSTHLWSLLDDQQKTQIQTLLNPPADQPEERRRGPGGSPVKRRVVDQINSLLSHEDFYSAEHWEGIRLPNEVESLQEELELTQTQLKRRNLLLLAAAFPRSINLAESGAISLMYANAVVQGPLPITREQFQPFFDQIVVGVVAIFLGFFGVLGTLLVTAGIMPRTFEPGEIVLLLSKPIRRSSLFVTKFIGGCIFTLLYGTVLVVGIWFLLGWRMDSWRPALLWCIPVYVFLFMIYYSVSAVAGAIWRNAIVAMMCVFGFWMVITVIGAVHEGLKSNLITQRGIREIALAGDNVVTVDGEQNTYVWDDSTMRWRQTFEEPPNQMSGFARRFMKSGSRFSPIYDAANDRILALQIAESRFGGMGAPQLVSGSADNDWERVELGRVPDVSTTILINSTGQIILPSSRKLFRYTESSAELRAGGDFLGRLTGGLFGGGSAAFQEIQGTDMPETGDHGAACIDPIGDVIFLFGEGQLHRMEPQEDETYALSKSRDFETESNGVLAASDSRVLLALADGRVLLLDAADLKTVTKHQLDDGVVPRVCTAAADGSTLALLTHAETVLLFDGDTGKSLPVDIAENGECAAVAFSTDGKLLVSDGRVDVREYDLSTGEVSREWSESTGWVYDFYDYAVHPAWTVLPKPSQLDQFVGYLMSGEKTVLVNERQGPPGSVDRGSLQQERDTFAPFPVIRDNLIFVIVMLSIGCWYVSRRDY